MESDSRWRGAAEWLHQLHGSVIVRFHVVAIILFLGMLIAPNIVHPGGNRARFLGENLRPC